MKRDSYDVGNVLCDMHDGFKDLPDNLEVVARIQVTTESASKIITAFFGVHPGNKYLTVVGDNMHGPVAAYSYDARYFGLVQLKHKPAAEETRKA
jgi:hypothetical protein